MHRLHYIRLSSVKLRMSGVQFFVFAAPRIRRPYRGAFKKRDDAEARELVCKRLASGASFLRDLPYTAWIESAKPVPAVDSLNQMQNPANPKYNLAAGSAPAP